MELFDEIEEKLIKTNGIKLHTVMIGEGPPLVLLHGFPDFWYGWKSVISGLKSKFKLIIPDMRGYNLSDKPEGVEKYKIEILVEDIKGLIEYLSLGKVFLAGHDWGGVVAWAFAEKYPDFLQKLAILNAPHMRIFQQKLRTDKKQQKASFYIFEFLKPDGEKFLFKDDYKWLKFAVFEGMKNKSNLTDFDKEQYLSAWTQPGAILGGVNYYRANVNFDDWTGKITVPTLVIHGMKDSAVLSSVLDELSDYVDDLKIVRAENSSHWVMHDQPELVVSSFKEFF
ncbi:MAG TPA: alpha/beta hydrolase [Candidatus Nanopelagicaceae bacterium]|nr:alpha/beta hydrolase [Candidatus Nanopelagicaceae bacterium]